MKRDIFSRIGWKFRLAIAHALLRTGLRRREIKRLFALTATAFGRPLPALRARGANGLLAEYALFTREQARIALDGGADPRDVECRLFKAAFDLGSGYRSRMDVRSFGEALAIARLIYGGLGIDFRGNSDGEVEVRRCGFARYYSRRVCILISALDRGLMAGLSNGGTVSFRQRLTEGAPFCRAYVTGGIR